MRDFDRDPALEHPSATTPEQLAATVTAMVNPIFQQMEWAEEEIASAQQRHPELADMIFHGFNLLAATHPRMAFDLVYRAHCREILDRLAAGADTRPGTAVEVFCACSDASIRAPLTSSAAGLYGRMWATAFPDHPNFLAQRQHHHEGLEASAIDDLEAHSRRTLTVNTRTLNDPKCTGQHHGETVHCRYAPTT